MTNDSLGLIAALVFAVSLAFWVRAMRRVEIPKNRTGFILTWTLSASMALIALFSGSDWVGGLAASLTLFASSFLIFTVSISQQRLNARSIRVGSKIPRFTALNENSEYFDSASLAGHRVLIKFFRGHW